MATFRPKEVFTRAREAEKNGRKRTASAHYSSLASYLRGKGKAKEAKLVLERAITLSPRFSQTLSADGALRARSQ